MRVGVNEFGFLSFKNRIILTSKNEIKIITSLHQKKYRNKYGLFVAEGAKLIADLFSAGLSLRYFMALEGTLAGLPAPEYLSEKELQKMSALKNTNGWLAVFEIPTPKVLSNDELIVVLDSVRDPGNLGTIIRLCDWFGVHHIVCSEDTVDCFNPKVVQSTMGSIARVSIHYTQLNEYLSQTNLPIYGAVLGGTSVYAEPLEKAAILVLGSEAHGISNSILSKLSHRIMIPNFGGVASAESLNVATASAILLNEFRRSTEK